MALIKKSRTLRPSTRLPSSPYRVNTEQVKPEDTLQLTIYYEENLGNPIGVFEFQGKDISGKNTIHFTATKQNGKWNIRFSGGNPKAIILK
jgi:hypothetical protein